MKKKQPFNYDEHRSTGILLNHVREYLLTLCCNISNRYGKTKPISLKANRSLKIIDSLRSDLEEQLFVDTRQADTGVYYGLRTGAVMIGKWFHSYNSEGGIVWQGQIVDRADMGTYVVQLYSWITTEPTIQKLVRLDEMMEWSFYPSSDDMNKAYQCATG